MSRHSKIAILIMAAGSSSRMGSPKQLLEWKSSNLLNHAISKALQLMPNHVFVVLGAGAEFIIPEIELKQANILINKDWKQGLGNSIRFGVNAVSRAFHDVKGILLLLPDQPLIELDHYSRLLKDFIPDRHQIIATEYEDGKLGVPALFDKSYFKELSDLNSDIGAKHVIRNYSDSVVSIKNKQANIDIDTYDRYLELYKANH
jgi:molybdenum cofactor cytidylyltransferase